ncbi:MAG: L,D-transpeptidase [Clostridiales bacterium]|nr:L,D-transpeptidase [Clostridiales bacterium]
MRNMDTLKNHGKGTSGVKWAAGAVLLLLVVLLIIGVLASDDILETFASGDNPQVQTETAGTQEDLLETYSVTESDTSEESTQLVETESVQPDGEPEDTEEADNTSVTIETENTSDTEDTEENVYDLTDVVEVPDVEYPYYIKVNRQANCVTVYTLDENGEYSVPVKAMICSVGLNNSTPTGVYTTSDKYTWRALYGGVYGQYAYRINGSIMFHSVPYYTTNKDDLETEEYNKLGEAASLGCIRLSCIDAKWLVDNCPSGTTVEIYDDEDPGPLGRPSAIKIDTESPYAGWDPTDPDPENPWAEAESSENTQEASESASEATSESDLSEQTDSEAEVSEKETESASEEESESAEGESASEATGESESSEQTDSEAEASEEESEAVSESESGIPIISVKGNSIVITISDEGNVRDLLLANLSYNNDNSSYRVILSYSDLTAAIDSRRFGTYTCTAYVKNVSTGEVSNTVRFTVQYVPSDSYTKNTN